MEDNSQYILSSLDNALSVLNLFFDATELSATEVAKLLGISRTAAFRILVTLEAKGYLTKTESLSYRLGIKLFSLGQLAHSRMVLSELVHPYLEELSEKTGETSHLAVMDGPYHMVFVDKTLGRLYLKMDTLLGYRRWAHQTATGKSMLAWQSDEYLRKYCTVAEMKALTATTITTTEGLLKEMRLIREQGWACDNEESELGLTCFAAPIFMSKELPLAAVSCSGPTTRMALHRERYISLLTSVARRVSARL